MASVFGAHSRSPSSSPCCYFQRYGARLCPSSCRKLHRLSLSLSLNLSFSDVACFSNYSVSLSAKALAKEILTNTTVAESLASEPRTLPTRYSHLTHLVVQLSESSDVGSTMEPWLKKLTTYDWNFLLREVGGKDWNKSWQIFSLYRERASVGESTSNVPEEIPSLGKSQEEVDGDSGRQLPVTKLHTSISRVLARNRRFEELDQLQQEMDKTGIMPDESFYNALLNLYVEESLIEKVSEVLSKMKAAGFEPNRSIYEKIAFMHMNQEAPNVDVPTSIMKDLMGRGVPVGVGIFKNLLKAYWRVKDVAGVEEIFQAMQAAGYTPDQKVLVKVIQRQGHNGNYERILELIEKLGDWGIQPNAIFYNYLVLAFCKSGFMDKATETMQKYDTKLGMKKPPLIAFNMLVNGYGRLRQHEEALKTFQEIYKNGYRPNVVSFSSIITAMVEAEQFDKAAQLYRKMIREKVQPNLHIYMTLVRCYTKRNWTREGRKIANAMRRASFSMTEAAYGTILAHFVNGNWYLHAASILRDMEKEGVPLDEIASGALIHSFSILGDKLTPLGKAIRGSNMELCKLLTILFIVSPSGLEPTHKEAVLSFLDKWKAAEKPEASLYNAFLECFWKRGYKGFARKVLASGRETYAAHTVPQAGETKWVLDVRGLSIGGSKVALAEWLSSSSQSGAKDQSDGRRMVVITGDEFQLTVVQDNRALKRALTSWLGELGSPFVEALEDPKKLEASAVEVMKWVDRAQVKELLSLADAPES